ncbi:MAG: OmpA family protein [Myxococcaceae bacterium]
MLMFRRFLIPVAVLAAFALTGCAHKAATVVTEAPKPTTAPPPVKVEAAPAPAAAAVTEQEDLKALLAGTVIHFGFDDAVLTPDSQGRLDRLASALRANPGTHIRIAGNCDERGTEEYNLALGQKRADAARKYLTALGVEGGRVDTVSYGDERPADPAHNNDAWATNRRDEFSPTRKD